METHKFTVRPLGLYNPSPAVCSEFLRLVSQHPGIQSFHLDIPRTGVENGGQSRPIEDVLDASRAMFNRCAGAMLTWHADDAKRDIDLLSARSPDSRLYSDLVLYLRLRDLQDLSLANESTFPDWCDPKIGPGSSPGAGIEIILKVTPAPDGTGLSVKDLKTGVIEEVRAVVDTLAAICLHIGGPLGDFDLSATCDHDCGWTWDFEMAVEQVDGMINELFQAAIARTIRTVRDKRPPSYRLRTADERASGAPAIL